MKTKFLTFFSLIAFVGLLSIIDSWILQYQAHGEISFYRVLFQVCLLALVLYLLWKRSVQSYILAVFYTVANAGLYGYELMQFFVFRNLQAELPESATVVSIVLIIAAVSALTLFVFDYLDYRKRRIQNP